jgi:hypothetical protein
MQQLLNRKPSKGVSKEVVGLSTPYPEAAVDTSSTRVFTVCPFVRPSALHHLRPALHDEHAIRHEDAKTRNLTLLFWLCRCELLSV